MIKRIVGRFSRWIRRASSRFCTIDSDKTARGLAKFLVRSPLTGDEKYERRRELLLQGVPDDKKNEAVSHFNNLSKETDPSENVERIPDNSVNKIVPDISVEDVQNRFNKVRLDADKSLAKGAIKGSIPWPVPPPGKRKS